LAPAKGENNFMLNQLVESGSHTKENKRRGGFLLSTLLVVCTIFLSGILWSLFAKDLKLGGGDFELSALVSPVPMPANEPPPPPQPKTERREMSQKTVEVATRQSNMERVDEARLIPKEISTVPNTQKARPIGEFKISSGAELDKLGQSSVGLNRGTGDSGVGISTGNEPSALENTKTVKSPPPPPLLAVNKENVKPPTIFKKSLGVINGIATNLVKPTYPLAAKAVKAEGAVNVQVTIDEQGNVVSANAVTGHPLLRQVSENAARSSKFKPTLLSNQPVKVTGVIVYKFTTQ
jgi:protein TonB